jgi:hypothetical protein
MRQTPRQIEIAARKRALRKKGIVGAAANHDCAAFFGISADAVRRTEKYVPSSRPVGRPPKVKVAA